MKQQFTRTSAQVLNLALACLVCALGASATFAQATRTWVSGTGDDANPCSRTAPCKTFAGTISKTAAGGEISVLDPGGYGAVTITKAITLNGAGWLAGISNSVANGIIVNAGVNDTVVIRNISLNGFGTGTNSIRFLGGKQLIVENVTINGVTGHGIDSAPTTAGASLLVKDTAIRNCGGTGVNIAGMSGNVLLDNVRIQGCGVGVAASVGETTVSRSVISQNTNQALLASASGAVINAEGCMLTDNATGVEANASGAVIRLSNSTITNNTTGISIAAGGSVVSFGNNKITGNTTNGAPSTLSRQK